VPAFDKVGIRHKQIRQQFETPKSIDMSSTLVIQRQQGDTLVIVVLSGMGRMEGSGSALG